LATLASQLECARAQRDLPRLDAVAGGRGLHVAHRLDRIGKRHQFVIREFLRTFRTTRAIRRNPVCAGLDFSESDIAAHHDPTPHDIASECDVGGRL
jgi:hypothetical protein